MVDWERAEALARELVTLFAAAGITIASAEALDYLRTAIERREATIATVQYVRERVMFASTGLSGTQD